jgi:N-acetylneuraminic acid mutarotase
MASTAPPALRTFSLFDHLPEEMKMECFSHLKEKDLCRSAGVCRRWNNLATDNALWPEYFKSFDPPAAKANQVPNPRVCHSAVVYNNKMIIFGGHNPLPGSNFISDVKNEMFEFSLETGEWTNITNDQMPARTEHASVMHQSKMYIVGGYSSQQGYRNDMITYDLETKQVSKIECKGSVPQGRSAHTAVVYNNDIYVFGGWNGGASNNEFFRYNIVRDEWTQVTGTGEAPAPRRSHCACVYGNAMYVWGGFNGTENCASTLHKFDFITKRWSVEPIKGIPPSGRSRARVVQYKNKMAIFGGVCRNQSWDRVNHFSDWHEFNFERREWKKKDISLLKEGIGQHSAVMHMNKVYVFGGYYAQQAKSTNALWAYCLGHLGKEQQETA